VLSHGRFGPHAILAQSLVITQLPNRLQSLSNKTLVIDGTLVTQRFHFAPMPHKYRHVLGWYRLIHELREHGIRTICVFDGEERTVAKSSEQNRRRHIRRTDVIRGEIESDRLRRLLALTRDLDTLRLLDKDERLHTMTSFRNRMSILESHLVPKQYSDRQPSTDHSLGRATSEEELDLAQRESPWIDEVDLDEIHHEDGLFVTAAKFTPEDIDAV